MRALALTLSTFLVANSLNAEALKPAMSAEISWLDENNTPISTVEAGTPFQIEVKVRSQGATDAASGMVLYAWLREIAATNGACEDAVRGFKVTGALPKGTVPLEDNWLGVLHEDQSFTIVNPDFDLASANIRAALRFDEMPFSIVADETRARFLVSLPKSGRILAISLNAEVETLAEGLNDPRDIFVAKNGRIYAFEHGATRLIALEKGATLFENVDAISQNGDALTIIVRESSTSKTGKVFDLSTAQIVQSFVPQNGDWFPYLEFGEVEGVIGIEGDVIAVNFGEETNRFSIPEPATQLAVAPSGRYAIAYDDNQNDLFIVDIGRGRAVQKLQTSSPVSQVTFTQNAAFAALRNESYVGAIDFRGFDAKRPVVVRQIQIGDGVSRDNNTVLAPLQRSNEVLAINTLNYTGFILHENSSMGDAPPMSGFRIRGGTPMKATAISTGFREMEDGVFRLATNLEHAKDYEIVLTSLGLGGLSVCTKVPMKNLVTTSASEQFELVIKDGVFVLQTEAGEPAASQQGTLLLSALGSHWQKRTPFVTNAKGEIAVANYANNSALAVTVELQSSGQILQVVER